jgi:hypothetical protein
MVEQSYYDEELLPPTEPGELVPGLGIEGDRTSSGCSECGPVGRESGRPSPLRRARLMRLSASVGRMDSSRCAASRQPAPRCPAERTCAGKIEDTYSEERPKAHA